MRKTFGFLLGAAVLLASCSTQDFPSLLARVETSTKDDVDANLALLENYAARGLSDKNAALLIDALPKCRIERKTTFQDTQTDLLRLLRKTKRFDPLRRISGIANSLSPGAVQEAILILSNFDSPDAVREIFALLDSSYGNPKPKNVMLRGWQERHFQSDAIFPRLFSYLDNTGYRYGIFLCTLEYLKSGSLDGERLAPLERQLHEYTAQYLGEISALKLDTAKKNWQYAESYAELREDLSILLDVSSYSNSPVLGADSLAAMDNPDPRIQFYALKSLVQHDRPVDRSAVARIAADPEMREWLFDYMQDRHRLDLFPQEYLDQERLAESDMVNWLLYPTELGVAPDEIQLGKRIVVKSTGEYGELEYFVFKYRTNPPHWASDKGWLAGVSGPFQVSRYPTTEALGSTFSDFQPWEGKTPEEHLGNIQAILDEWNKKR